MNNIVRESIMAGILIGLGAYGYLTLGGIPGAVIFAFGLICVVLMGAYLYTGKAGVLTNIGNVTTIWFFNILACGLIGLMVWYLGGKPVETAQEIVANRLATEPLKVFLKALGCGLIIDLSCAAYRGSKSLLPILFGVPLFIILGFYHSIADVVYIVAAWDWSKDLIWYYPLIVVGNYVGCNIRRLVYVTRWIQIG